MLGCLTPPRQLLFLFNDPATTAIYTLSLHDALPIFTQRCSIETIPAKPRANVFRICFGRLKKAARTRSEEHTSELQSRFDLVCRLLLEKKNPCSAARRREPRPRAPSPTPWQRIRRGP